MIDNNFIKFYPFLKWKLRPWIIKIIANLLSPFPRCEMIPIIILLNSFLFKNLLCFEFLFLFEIQHSTSTYPRHEVNIFGRTWELTLNLFWRIINQIYDAIVAARRLLYLIFWLAVNIEENVQFAKRFGVLA